MLTLSLVSLVLAADGGLGFSLSEGAADVLEKSPDSVNLAPAPPLQPSVVVLPAAAAKTDLLALWRDDRFVFDAVVLARASAGAGLPASPVLPIALEREGSVVGPVMSLGVNETLYFAWEVHRRDGSTLVRACHRPLASQRVDWCEDLRTFPDATVPRFATAGGAWLGVLEAGQLVMRDLASAATASWPLGMVEDFSFADHNTVVVQRQTLGQSVLTGPGLNTTGTQPYLVGDVVASRTVYVDLAGDVRDGRLGAVLLAQSEKPWQSGPWVAALGGHDVTFLAGDAGLTLSTPLSVLDYAPFESGGAVGALLEDDLGSNEALLEFQESPVGFFEPLGFDRTPFLFGLSGAEGLTGAVWAWNSGRGSAATTLVGGHTTDGMTPVGGAHLAWSTEGALATGIVGGRAVLALVDGQTAETIWNRDFGPATGVTAAAGAGHAVVVLRDREAVSFQFLPALSDNAPAVELDPLPWAAQAGDPLRTLTADCLWSQPVCLVSLDTERTGQLFLVDAAGSAPVTLSMRAGPVVALSHDGSSFWVLRRTGDAELTLTPVTAAGQVGADHDFAAPTERPFLVPGSPPLLVGEADGGLGFFGGTVVVRRGNACASASRSLTLAGVDAGVLRLVGATSASEAVGVDGGQGLRLLFEQVALHEVSWRTVAVTFDDPAFSCARDGGVDAGISPPDAGSPDAGVTGPDAGVAQPDGGNDGGTADAGAADGGTTGDAQQFAVCGCSGAPATLVLLALGLVRRRRCSFSAATASTRRGARRSSW